MAGPRHGDNSALLQASLQKRGGVVRARGADEGASRTAADAAATGKPAPCAAPAVVSTPSTLHLVCAAAFVCLLLCLMVLPTLVAMSALWTPWLRLPVCAYLAWALYDLPGASSGAWRGNGAVRDWLLGWPLWEPFRAYFPARLVVTAPVDPNRNYILGFHPHGVYCISLLANIILNPSFTSTIGLRPRIATLPINFVLPVWRDVITHLGVVSCDRVSLRRGLACASAGTCLVIAVGGSEEFCSMDPGTMDLVLEKRKGFVRLALTTGASLLPVIGFGENELYERLRHPLFDPLHKAAYYTARMAAPLFVGRFMTPIPFRTPLTTVFGPPIYVDKVETPTCEQVDALHKQYLAALQRLYDQHKDEFHAHRRQEMRFVA